MIPTCTILQCDCLQVLKTLPDESVHCVVTSPPYWGLRDYGVEGQLGLEKTPEEYVEKMVRVFREVRRVLREDGTAWVNMGDAYAHNGSCGGASPDGEREYRSTDKSAQEKMSMRLPPGLKPKDLCGIPWRLAFALQADGWWLRQDIIWHKPNPMPESVTDRCTKSHEYLFLITKSARYFFDAEAIKEPSVYGGYKDARAFVGKNGEQTAEPKWDGCGDPTRNRRSVWTINSEPYPESHFATFPTALVKPCILAGTSAMGCCPKCGAPWERVVEKTGGTTGTSWHDHAHDSEQGMHQVDKRELEDAGGEYRVTTTGWRPTCECHFKPDPLGEGELEYTPADPIPCTVLDPFGGSGTTGQVAIELGRSAILIELNPSYVKLAEKRTNVTPGLAIA